MVAQRCPCQSPPWTLQSHQYQGRKDFSASQSYPTLVTKQKSKWQCTCSFPTTILNLHFLTFAFIPLSDIRHSRLCISPLLDDNLYLPTCCSNSWRFWFFSSTFHLCVTRRDSRDCQLQNKICMTLTGKNKNIYFHVSPIRTVSLLHLLEKAICILLTLRSGTMLFFISRTLHS